MRIRRTAMLAASILALSPWAPAAHATTDGTVKASFITSYNAAVGGGWFATVTCRAVASTTPPATVPPDTDTVMANAQQVALATEVTCSINDTSRSVTTAGPAAVSEVTLVAGPGQLMACVTAKSVMMDTVDNRIYIATATPTCTILPNT